VFASLLATDAATGQSTAVRVGVEVLRPAQLPGSSYFGFHVEAIGGEVLVGAPSCAARMLVVKLLLGVIFGLGGAGALWWFVLRTPEAVNIAQQALAAANQHMRSAETAISVRSPREAETNRLAGIKIIEIKELNFAKEGANPEDPELASMELAAKAAEISKTLDTTIKAKVEQLEQDIRVEGNLRTVQSGFGRLVGDGAFTDPELSTFERQVHEFLDNPVLPGAGANESYQTEYENEIKQIKYEVAKIEREKARRTSLITDIPVREARDKATILVQKSRFQDALAMVDEMQRTYEGANFAGIRQFVREAAELAWNSDLSRANENYTTYKAAGTTPALAADALKAARGIMQHVIDNFGIPDYVSKAETTLKSYTK
jgi:hypothetical protein